MKPQREGTSILLTRAEFEAVLRHLKEFEKIVKELEHQDAASKLPEEWRETWRELKSFLESEELEGSQEQDNMLPDGRYCCELRSKPTGQVVNCRNYNAWYIFAWTACVAEALVGSFNARLLSGRCRKHKRCPQAK